ncbi:MAG: porin, partial [Verrucomicrobia bacterium]
YSRTYIFNFGTPFYGVGALATMHACPNLDVYGGITRGVNVGTEDNNDSVSFYGGLGLNCCDGKVACAAITHIGPENPRDNHDYRYLNDIVTTWKITNKLTSITDINFIYEESVNAKGYGIAQYLTYAVNDCCTIGIRGEVWRDADGFFVAQFASNNDFIHFERGDDTVFDPRTTGGGRTTYGALTAGVMIKPPKPALITDLMIRPEIRYDRSLNNTRPFNDSSDRDMLTAAMDVVVTF